MLAWLNNIDAVFFASATALDIVVSFYKGVFRVYSCDFHIIRVEHETWLEEHNLTELELLVSLLVLQLDSNLLSSHRFREGVLSQLPSVVGKLGLESTNLIPLIAILNFNPGNVRISVRTVVGRFESDTCDLLLVLKLKLDPRCSTLTLEPLVPSFLARIEDVVYEFAACASSPDIEFSLNCCLRLSQVIGHTSFINSGVPWLS